MVNAISTSKFNSMVKRGTDELMKEHNRRAITQVFENAVYNKQGFAQATHVVGGRAYNKSGHVVKAAIMPILEFQPQSLLKKSVNFLAKLVKCI